MQLELNTDDGLRAELEIRELDRMCTKAINDAEVDAEGLPVLDDVGGIYGYGEFLKGVHGVGEDPYEDKDETTHLGQKLGMDRPNDPPGEYVVEIDRTAFKYYNVLHKAVVNDSECNSLYGQFDFMKGGIIMAISVRLSDADDKLIKQYAMLHNISVSELFRQAVMERIENEYDLSAYNVAMEEFKKDPVTYSLDEVERELGLK